MAAAWAISSVGEHCLHTAGVAGSIPASPTNKSIIYVPPALPTHAAECDWECYDKLNEPSGDRSRAARRHRIRESLNDGQKSSEWQSVLHHRLHQCLFGLRGLRTQDLIDSFTTVRFSFSMRRAREYGRGSSHGHSPDEVETSRDRGRGVAGIRIQCGRRIHRQRVLTS